MKTRFLQSFFFTVLLLFINACANLDDYTNTQEKNNSISLQKTQIPEEIQDVNKAIENTSSNSYFPLSKGLTWEYRNTWIDYPDYRNELVDIKTETINENIKTTSFEGIDNITSSSIPYEGTLTEYYKNEDGLIKLVKTISKITYYGETTQEIMYEINYAPSIVLLEEDVEPKIGDKFITDTQITIYAKEDGACFFTYDFPAQIIVKITNERMMIVSGNETKTYEFSISDIYNWVNSNEYCEKNKDNEKYKCPSKKFKPHFLNRKIYLAKGIGPVRFIGEENILGFGDFVGQASPKPIIDILE